MSGKAGRMVAKTCHGAAADGGHVVEFSLAFQDGSEETFRCQAHDYAPMLATLTTYGGLAERARLTSAQQPMDVCNPFLVTGVPNSAYARQPRVVAVEFATNKGFPVQLAMSPSNARRTIELLQRELDRLAEAEHSEAWDHPVLRRLRG